MSIQRLILILLSVANLSFAAPVPAEEPSSVGRIAVLEQQLLETQSLLEDVQTVISSLAVEISRLKAAGTDSAAEVEAIAQTVVIEEDYVDRILVTDLGGDERDHELTPRPELFLQTRYHANPIDEATERDVTRNFGLNRMELRWAGRVSERLGMGAEIQYHPAPDGAAEELVNDAYVEYFLNDAVTLRIGQFVKPFGFDIQHSSSDRESPERGIFAGYFFPGQRDRGAMLRASLDRLAPWASGVTVYAGVFNGNRFFNDNNDNLNYNFRIRKIFGSRLAVGASIQSGTQIAPFVPNATADEDLYGVDLQYVIGRLGIRAEYVRGDMPSTLLSLEPEFAPAFASSTSSSGAAAFFNYNLSVKDDIYWRWDRFHNDPVTGRDIRAFNLGYIRAIGDNSRIGIDYQKKNDVTFNDDELNTKLSITWNMEY